MGDSDGTKCWCTDDVLPREVVNTAGGICAVSSLLRHVGVMTSETLARAGTRGRLVVQEARGPKGWGVTRVVSTALTLTPESGLHTREKPHDSNDTCWAH